MGLDMYLRGKRWIGFDERRGDGCLGHKVSELFPELASFREGRGDEHPVSEVSVEVGYWRKANAVHRWFVGTVQAGNDDCGYYPVERGDMETLRGLCVQVLANPGGAPEILPTLDGFFFGDGGYGEWYMADIQNTIHILDRALLLPPQWHFEYHSSW